MDPPENDQPVPTLSGGRYVIERKLGEGGHAAVYRVVDTRLGVKRAIKIMLAEAARRTKMRARFENEARTMAALDHPHVVRVIDVVLDAPIPYMVMELLTGGTLWGWLDAHGPMPPRLAASCARQAALGVGAAHGQGVVHRDIKPHNVLVSSGGVCKVTDFGIARAGEGGLTRSGAAMGTQGYMAPEQAKDASTVDVRVDVFSLGMTLFVLLTGRDPLERVAGRGLDLVPEALRSLVDRSTAFDRNRRPADAAAFVAEIDQALAVLPADPPAADLAQPESEGEDLDWDEISTLGDAQKTTDTTTLPHTATPRTPTPTSTPRILPYRVPTPVAAAADATPDWVDRDTEPLERRGPMEVKLDEASRQATRAAAVARGEEPPEEEGDPDKPREPFGGEIAEEAGGVLRELGDIVIRNLTDPWRMAGPAIGLLLFLGAVFMQTTGLRTAANDAREARQEMLAALKADRGGLEDVVALGGNRDALETLYTDWERTTDEPARTQALARYVSALENDLKAYGAPGVPAADRARGSIVELKKAMAAYEQKVEAYEAQRDSVAGCMAIGVAPP